MPNPSPLSVLKSPAWVAMLLLSIAAVFADETWLPLLGAPPEVGKIFRGIGLGIGILMMTPLGRWMRSDGKIIGPLVVLAIVMLSVPNTGCATWADSARTTIEASAVAVNVADHAVASSLSTVCASVEALPAASPERAAALDACLSTHHYDDAIAAIRVADRALRAAQAAVDAGERAGDPAPWRGVAACVAESVTQVLAAVHEAGVDVPPELTRGASLLAAIAGVCRPTDTSDPVARHMPRSLGGQGVARGGLLS
jgi:hypothetical protein